MVWSRGAEGFSLVRAIMEEFCSTLTIMNLCQRLFVARFCCNNKSLRGRSFLSNWFTKRKPFASQSLVVQYMHNWRRGRQHKPLRAWPWTDRGQYSQQGRAKAAAHLVHTPCACYMPPAPHTHLHLTILEQLVVQAPPRALPGEVNYCAAITFPGRGSITVWA